MREKLTSAIQIPLRLLAAILIFSLLVGGSSPSNAAQPSFLIFVNPERVEVTQGDPATFTIVVSTNYSSPIEVSLRLSGLPADASYQITPQTVTTPGAATLEVSTEQLIGSFTFTVVGEGGGTTGSATGTLVVRPSGEPPWRCVIATAAYGSELAPEVQELRTFRDRIVSRTFSGSSFLGAFNAFYYSWSPALAGFISNKPSIRSVVRASLAPLLDALFISKTVVGVFGGPSEFSIVLSGLLASALIGISYLTIPGYVVLRATGLRVRRGWLKALGLTWVVSIVALAVGTVLKVYSILAPAAAVLVITTLTASPTLVIEAVRRQIDPRD